MLKVSSSGTTGLSPDADPECLPSYFVPILFKRFIALRPRISSSKLHIKLSDITGVSTLETIVLFTQLLDKATLEEDVSHASETLRLFLLMSGSISPMHQLELFEGLAKSRKILPSVPSGRSYIRQAIEFCSRDERLLGEGKTENVQEAVNGLIASWNCVFATSATHSTVIEQAVKQGIIPTLEMLTMSDLVLLVIPDHGAIQLSSTSSSFNLIILLTDNSHSCQSQLLRSPRLLIGS